MNEKITTFIHDNYRCIFFVMLCIVPFAAFFYGRSCGEREAGNNSGIQATIHNLNENVEKAGSSIIEAQKENGAARDAIDRASNSIGEVRERTERSQAELREARELVDECLRLNRSAKAGLREAAAASK